MKHDHSQRVLPKDQRIIGNANRDPNVIKNGEFFFTRVAETARVSAATDSEEAVVLDKSESVDEVAFLDNRADF